MPIKKQNGEVEPFAGEVDPRGRLRMTKLKNQAEGFGSKYPYFVGEFTDKERKEWVEAWKYTNP